MRYRPWPKTRPISARDKEQEKGTDSRLCVVREAQRRHRLAHRPRLAELLACVEAGRRKGRLGRAYGETYEAIREFE